VLQTVQRNDAVIELDERPSDPQMMRLNRVAWLNTRRN
jgi:hypothetical protein